MSIQNKSMVTPAGAAQYAFIHKADTKFNADGEYKIKLILGAKEAAPLVAQLTEVFELSVAAAKEANKGKRIKEGELPFVENDDNTVTFAFKLKAKVNPKVGTPFEQKPAVFDAKGQPVVGDSKLGNGSTVKVAFEAIPYYTAIAGAGVSLRLKAVQIIKLVQYVAGGASAGSSFGFGVEEGFSASETPAESAGFVAEENTETVDYGDDF